MRHVNSSGLRQCWRGCWWPSFLLAGLLGNTVTYSGLPGRVCGYFWVVDFKQNYAKNVWERQIETERKEASILGCTVLCGVPESCPALHDSVGSSPLGSSVHGVLQARTLEWVAVPSSRGSSQPRDQTQVSRIAGRFFTLWATREAHNGMDYMKKYDKIQMTLTSKKIIIYLTVWGLSCNMQDFPWGMWDLVFWPGVEPRPPALGPQSLSHWTTRGVPSF